MVMNHIFVCKTAAWMNLNFSVSVSSSSCEVCFLWILFLFSLHNISIISTDLDSSLEVTLNSAARSVSLWHETTVSFCLEMSWFSERSFHGSFSPQWTTVSQTPPDTPLTGCRLRRWDSDYTSLLLFLLSDCRRRNRSISVWSDWRSSDVINHTCPADKEMKNQEGFFYLIRQQLQLFCRCPLSWW